MNPGGVQRQDGLTDLSCKVTQTMTVTITSCRVAFLGRNAFRMNAEDLCKCAVTCRYVLNVFKGTPRQVIAVGAMRREEVTSVCMNS
jgi:hypothetical protein